jgi:hypothetical protein
MNNNFISLSNDDIIIYNKIQSKVYKYFITFHKCSGIKFDELIKNSSLNQNELYKISQNYCKDFKYNICLCNRYFYKNCLANDNYTEIYKCNNNKKILYNINNFSFVNPVKFNYNDEKIFSIDIFTFYRQEYIPFIINEEFIKYKNKKSNIKYFVNKRLSSLFHIFKNYKNKKINKKLNIKLANGFRLSSLFYIFKEYRFKDNKITLKYFFKLFYSYYMYNKLHSLYDDNSYYNELINVFDTKSLILNN